MSVLFNGAVSGSSTVDTGDIGHSLRFRSAASAYLSRTFGTPASTTKMTLSTWIKPAAISTGFVNAGLISLADPTTSGVIICGTGAFGAGVQDRLLIRNGGANKDYWNLVFRDPTSFVHIFLSIDTTQATQADRARLWVNGVEQTKASSALGASEAIGWNAAGTVTINGNTASYYGEYYGSRHVLLDNKCVQQGTASVSDFGYLNTEINEWVTKSQSAVKAVVDAGGTNSFMLDFDNGTSLTTLGYDKSSKGNNWTLNNFSLTAGTSYDWMLDVPGNSFATFNPLVSANASTLVALSNANLSSTLTDRTKSNKVRASTQMSSGFFYWEIVATSVWGISNGGTYVGVVSGEDAGVSGAAVVASIQVQGHTTHPANYGATGCSGVTDNVTPSTAGDVFRCAFDATNGKLWIQRNASGWIGGGDPVNGTSPTFYGIPTGVYVATAESSGHSSLSNSTATNEGLFGQAPLHASATYDSASGGYFRYTPPAGYKALCQRNLPDPAILNPEKHFDVDVYTGTGSALNRTGFQLQPDFVWIKGRASAYTHALFDSIRGVTKILNSNTTDAEATESAGAGLTAFNADGYSLGTNAADASTNVNTQTFVSWLWKAGGAAVTNNAGSISSQVSANVTAGFSIVTYTGNATDNATFGHGLGVVPGLVIIKARTSTAAETWNVWHKSLAAETYFLRLDSTSAVLTAFTNRQKSHSSTTVTLGNNTEVNESTKTYVAYCFSEIAGFSKIFSYTGNGSTDGPYVHCGFKPKFILVKRTDSSTYGNWEIIDTVRDTYNQSFNDLIANLSNAENVDGASWDILSNGFKCRDGSSTGNKNVSGGTYIGIAFADVPGKYSLGR